MVENHTKQMTPHSIVITWKGNTYVIHKEEPGENEAEFRTRAWWIVKNYKHAPITELIALSYIWSAVRSYKVKYSDTIMKRLDDFTDVYT